MELSAPAKLNLGLRVLDRRPDGYHRIESLFVPLEFADLVELEVQPAGRPQVALHLEGGDAGVPAGPENLAVRAAHAFLEAAVLAVAVRIRLRKRVPAGAGLGGGSSDAGAVLRALDQLFPASVRDAAGLALGLGADVPYFLDPRPAWVSGVGETIHPLAGLPSLPVVVVWPEARLSTAQVYRAHDADPPTLTPQCPAPTMPLPSWLGSGPVVVEALAGLLRNDLERVASRLCPEIPRLRERVQSDQAM